MIIPKENIIYSYNDYLSWPDDERWEIIQGIPVSMSPAPSTNHQSVSGELFFILKDYFKDKDCSVFIAPFDVRLSENLSSESSILNVVQPDIAIICDKNKIDKKGCLGSPDMVVEVISPGSALMDYKTKLNLYEKFKIKEYWIVNPSEKIVHIYILSGIEYKKPEVFSEEDIIRLGIFPDCEIRLENVFKNLITG